jgi:hypothetical protein
MTQIDEKALAAASNAFDEVRLMGGDPVRRIITAYLAALPPPVGDVGELVQRLREYNLNCNLPMSVIGDAHEAATEIERLREQRSELMVTQSKQVKNLVAQIEPLSARLAEATKMLSAQDYEYNRKTNALIERHARQIQETTARAEQAEYERDVWKSKSTMHSRDAAEQRQRAYIATTRTERLEAALRPFAKAADVKLCGEWRDDERFGQTDVNFYLTFGDLRNARAALSPSPAGGEDGWVLVPKEPTEAMLQAALNCYFDDYANASDFEEDDCRRTIVSEYRAMIAAATAKGGV